MTVVTAMVSIAVAMAVTVSTSVAVAVVGIGLSLSGPLAPGHGGEGVSGQTGGVVVAVVAGVDVVVVDSNAVAVVGIGISAPLAVVVTDNTVETLGRPGNEGGGDTRVGSNAKTESVAVAVGAGSIDGALVAVADSRGPGSRDAAGSNNGVAVGSVESISISISAPLSVGVGAGSIDCALVAVANGGGPGGGDAGGADQGVAVEGFGGGGRGQAGGDQN